MLAAVPGIGHAFSTRLDAVAGPFDLGRHDLIDPVTDDRRRRLLREAGLGGRAVVLHQVHGDRVAAVDEAARTTGLPLQADGVWSSAEGSERNVPCVRTADCVPLLLADRDGEFVAAVHAGWRGTAAGIAGAAVGELARAGVEPRRLVAALGPSIGPCCYEVGREVLAAVADACGPGAGRIRADGPDGSIRLDLAGANRLQLLAAGLDEARISRAPWCTACRPDLFFSYRAAGGPTGSLMACVGRLDGSLTGWSG